MRRLFLSAFLLMSVVAHGSGVQWGCFTIADVDWGGGGYSLQYTLGYSPYPEAGYTVTKGTLNKRTLTFVPEYSNCGDNATFWATAVANTILDADWADQATPLMDLGYTKDYTSGGTVTLNSSQSAYIAFVGKSLWMEDGQSDYYTGWIQIKNNKGEIEIVSSALAIGSALAVGTGDTYAFSKTPLPTPEPTSGLLLLVGAAGLALRRRKLGSVKRH